MAPPFEGSTDDPTRAVCRSSLYELREHEVLRRELARTLAPDVVQEIFEASKNTAFCAPNDDIRARVALCVVARLRRFCDELLTETHARRAGHDTPTVEVALARLRAPTEHDAL